LLFLTAMEITVISAASPAHAGPLADLRETVTAKIARGTGDRAFNFDIARMRLGWLRTSDGPGGVAGQMIVNDKLKTSSLFATRDQYRPLTREALRSAEAPLGLVRMAKSLNIAPPLLELERALALVSVAEHYTQRSRSSDIHDKAQLRDRREALNEELQQEIGRAVYHGEVQRVDRLIELLGRQVPRQGDPGLKEVLAPRLTQAMKGRLELARYGAKERPSTIAVIPLKFSRPAPRVGSTEGEEHDARVLDSPFHDALDALTRLGVSTRALKQEATELGLPERWTPRSLERSPGQ
jgi:hypothetical protein